MKLLIAAIAVIVALALWRLPVLLLDGADGEFLALLAGDQSVFAAGYSDLGFLRVRSGMSPDEVQALLGEPVERGMCAEDDRSCEYYWVYSRPSANGSFRVREVTFRRGQVSKIYSSFWVD